MHARPKFSTLVTQHAAQERAAGCGMLSSDAEHQIQARGTWPWPPQGPAAARKVLNFTQNTAKNRQFLVTFDPRSAPVGRSLASAWFPVASWMLFRCCQGLAGRGVRRGVRPCRGGALLGTEVTTSSHSGLVGRRTAMYFKAGNVLSIVQPSV